MPSLEFKGKQYVYAHHRTVPYRPLTPDPGKSMGGMDSGDNLIVHGDNLHALKALLPRYAGRVKCVYIDPPYNTGNERWSYNDNVSGPLMREWLERNGFVDREDLERHDKWLCMMWPRLQLLRELLADDGVIFVSVDDNEHHHLRMLMNELFGEENLVTAIAWQSRASVQNDTDISVNHEYVLAYAKQRRQKDRRLREGNADRWFSDDGFAMLPITLDHDKFSNADDDPRGPWKADPFDAPNIRPNLTYEIVNPVTGQGFMPPRGRCWRMTEDRFREALADNRIVFGKSGRARPQLKTFYHELDDYGSTETTWFDAASMGTATSGTQELERILGAKRFPSPKPSSLITHLLRLATRDDAIVLDSFAGSGTTAHAVLALNREDGGNRRFILVECEDYADAITAERVRRVIAGVPDARDAALREGLGGSFTYCTLGDPVTVEGMLTGETLPPFASLAAWLLHTATGVVAESSALSQPGGDGLFHEDEGHNYHLLYEPDLEWLRSGEAVLNEERAKRIGTTARERGKEALVFAAAKYLGQRELTEYGVTFCQLPYELHRRG